MISVSLPPQQERECKWQPADNNSSAAINILSIMLPKGIRYGSFEIHIEEEMFDFAYARV